MIKKLTVDKLNTKFNPPHEKNGIDGVEKNSLSKKNADRMKQNFLIKQSENGSIRDKKRCLNFINNR